MKPRSVQKGPRWRRRQKLRWPEDTEQMPQGWGRRRGTYFKQ